MSTDKIKKKHIFVAVYIILLVVELFFYVPYEEIEIFRSKQNVPRTEIIGSGYLSMEEIRKDVAALDVKDMNATGKRVDSGQLVANLFATTVFALFVYFIFIYSEDKDEEVKREFELLQRKADVLYRENQILNEYKSTYFNIIDALSEAAKKSSMPDITKTPYIDINALAFADEATQNEALKQYTDDITAYVAYKIYKSLNHTGKK